MRREKREARSEKRKEGQQGDGERVGDIPLLPRVMTLILMIQWSSTSFFVPFVSTNNNIRKRDREGRGRGGGEERRGGRGEEGEGRRGGGEELYFEIGRSNLPTSDGTLNNVKSASI